MRATLFLSMLSITGIFLGVVALYIRGNVYNYYLDNIGFPLLYSAVFLLMSTHFIEFILRKKINKYFQIGLILISLPVLLLCSGGLFGVLPLLKWDLEGALFYLLYWGSWGISFGFFFGVPIYLIVIFLLYRDHRKRIT